MNRQNESKQRSFSPDGKSSEIEKKSEVIPGKPLDYSYCDIQNINEILPMKPRGGHKRSPPKEEKNRKKQDDENGAGGEGSPSEEKKMEIFKPPPTEKKIMLLVKQCSIPLYGAKTGVGNLKKDSKGEERKKIIHRECNSLLLTSNLLESIQGIKAVVDTVMYNPENLQWLDLAFNKLQIIDAELLSFPRLKTLYLHCNKIDSVREVRKLSRLPELRHLTLYGNPISKVPHYRNYIISVLPQIFKLDSNLITKKEIINSIVYFESFGEKKIAFKNEAELRKRWEDRKNLKLIESSKTKKQFLTNFWNNNL